MRLPLLSSNAHVACCAFHVSDFLYLPQTRIDEYRVHWQTPEFMREIHRSWSSVDVCARIDFYWPFYFARIYSAYLMNWCRSECEPLNRAIKIVLVFRWIIRYWLIFVRALWPFPAEMNHMVRWCNIAFSSNWNWTFEETMEPCCADRCTTKDPPIKWFLWNTNARRDFRNFRRPKNNNRRSEYGREKRRLAYRHLDRQRESLYALFSMEAPHIIQAWRNDRIGAKKAKSSRLTHSLSSRSYAVCFIVVAIVVES